MKNMNTKLLMTASSIIMGAIGVISTFLPDETLLAFGQTPTPTLSLFIQILGALYFGFAIMNWMAKTVLIGGIYAKPLSMGNFAHFVIGGLALIKMAINSDTTSILIWVLIVIYALFALLFSVVSFTNPNLKASK